VFAEKKSTILELENPYPGIKILPLFAIPGRTPSS
jgi:hypothetical protein